MSTTPDTSAEIVDFDLPLAESDQPTVLVQRTLGDTRKATANVFHTNNLTTLQDQMDALERAGATDMLVSAGGGDSFSVTWKEPAQAA